MANFNPELIKALANGDQQAFEQVKNLPLPERIAIGNAVDKLRRDESIIPMSNGMSLYEQPKSKYTIDEEVGKSMAERIQKEKEAEALKEKIRQEHLEKQAKQKAERARALGSWQ